MRERRMERIWKRNVMISWRWVVMIYWIHCSHPISKSELKWRPKILALQ